MYIIALWVTQVDALQQERGLPPARIASGRPRAQPPCPAAAQSCLPASALAFARSACSLFIHFCICGDPPHSSSPVSAVGPDGLQSLTLLFSSNAPSRSVVIRPKALPQNTPAPLLSFTTLLCRLLTMRCQLCTIQVATRF